MNVSPTPAQTEYQRIKKYRVTKPKMADPVCRERKCNNCGQTFQARQFMFTCDKCHETHGRKSGLESVV